MKRMKAMLLLCPCVVVYGLQVEDRCGAGWIDVDAAAHALQHRKALPSGAPAVLLPEEDLAEDVDRSESVDDGYEGNPCAVVMLGSMLRRRNECHGACSCSGCV